MKTTNYLVFPVITIIAVLCFSCSKKTNPTTYTFNIEAKSSTSTSGTVSLQQKNANEVVLTVKASNLTPGDHGMHIHAVGDCSAADGTSAGAHWDPLETKTHGFCSDGVCSGTHAGDMGNLVADASGNVTFTFTSKQWCINCSDDTKNINNKAIIIHANKDDLSSATATGNSGGRIGCVVLNFDK